MSANREESSSSSSSRRRPRTPGGRAGSTPDDAAAATMDGLRRLVRALGTSARGAAPGGVSGAQVFVLRQIAAAPGLSLGELARRTLARQSTISEVVARLVARGLVRRAVGAADARQAVLTLTARGERAIARVGPTTQERLADGLAALPASTRAALATGISEWLAAAGLADTAPTMFFESPRLARPRRGGGPARSTAGPRGTA